jgi:hypothetical protein
LPDKTRLVKITLPIIPTNHFFHGLNKLYPKEKLTAILQLTYASTFVLVDTYRVGYYALS